MLESVIEEQFGVKLGNFAPCASYYEDMDYVEYVSSPSLTVAERIDPFLTILWDKNQDKVIGFKVKGFRNLFETKLKALYDLKNEEFVELTSALEILYTDLGIQMIAELNKEQQEQTKKAYRLAMSLAANDNVMLYEVPKQAA